MTASARHDEDSTEPFAHQALFYRNVDEYVLGVLAFIREGLANNEPVAVAVPGPNLALLRRELGSDASSVRLMDMTVEGRNPGRIIPGVLRVFADDYASGRVRIIGEHIWSGRSSMQYPACVAHEALINAAFAGREVSILCPYDVARLDPLVLVDAEATHPVLIDGNGERASGAYDPERIVAAYNRPLPAPPPTAVVVAFDLSSLAQIRRAVVGHARRACLAEERVMDLELAVAEATANSVVHGGGSGTVAVWVEAAELRCQVRDRGHITDLLAGRLPVDTRQPGGRGLLLVNLVVDLLRLYTDEHGTVLQLHFALPS